MLDEDTVQDKFKGFCDFKTNRRMLFRYFLKVSGVMSVDVSNLLQEGRNGSFNDHLRPSFHVRKEKRGKYKAKEDANFNA